MKVNKLILFSVLLAFVYSTSVLGQAKDAYTIKGTIIDAAGERVPNVNVTLLKLDQTDSVALKSNFNGNYTIEFYADWSEDVTFDLRYEKLGYEKDTISYTIKKRSIEQQEGREAVKPFWVKRVTMENTRDHSIVVDFGPTRKTTYNGNAVDVFLLGSPSYRR